MAGPPGKSTQQTKPAPRPVSGYATTEDLGATLERRGPGYATTEDLTGKIDPEPNTLFEGWNIPEPSPPVRAKARTQALARVTQPAAVPTPNAIARSPAPQSQPATQRVATARQVRSRSDADAVSVVPSRGASQRSERSEAPAGPGISSISSSLCGRWLYAGAGVVSLPLLVGILHGGELLAAWQAAAVGAATWPTQMLAGAAAVLVWMLLALAVGLGAGGRRASVAGGLAAATALALGLGAWQRAGLPADLPQSAHLMLVALDPLEAVTGQRLRAAQQTVAGPPTQVPAPAQ